MEHQEENQPVMVICGPADSAEVLGSKIYKCAGCGDDCACSPVGQKHLDKGGKPYCMDCGSKHVMSQMAQGNLPDVLDPSDAIQCAADHLGISPKELIEQIKHNIRSSVRRN